MINILKKYILPCMIMFSVMLFMGISDNIKGMVIPSIKSEFGINDSSIGIMLVCGSIGYIIFTYISGILIEKIGHKKTYLYSFFMSILAVVVLHSSKNFSVVLLGMFLLGASVSYMNICTSTLVPIVFIKYQAIFMGFAHFSYGAGATVGQRAIGIMLGKGISWRTIYLLISLLSILIIILISMTSFPSVKLNKKKSIISFYSVIKNKVVIMYMLALGFYVSAEVLISTWFINFLISTYHYNESRGSYYISIFFFLFSIGRLLGGFIAEKLGYSRSIIVFLLFAIMLLSIGIYGGEAYLISISISGFFFSLVYPTMVVKLSNIFVENRAYILGIIFTGASIISNGLNFLIGHLNDLFGAYKSFSIVPVALCISLVSFLVGTSILTFTIKKA